MITLSGLVLVKNGDELDYCWREAVHSLLPVCEEVVICDGESSDGTREAAIKWSEQDAKIKFCSYPWPDPKGDIDFYVNWIQYGRQHIRSDFVFHMDADEVISERSYERILDFKAKTDPAERVSIRMNRYNFWRDLKHLIPVGKCCGHQVIRISPKDVWLPTDACHDLAIPCVLMSYHDPQMEIFHYGYLRNREAYFIKQARLTGYFFNRFELADADARLDQVKDKPGNWMEEIQDLEWKDELIPFEQPHPIVMQSWLKERGWM